MISSTWRTAQTLDDLKAYFSPDLAPRIIDVTPAWRDLPDLLDTISHTYVRQVEIEGWLRASERPWEIWIAIDDKAYWFKPFLPNLIISDARFGLANDDVVDKLRKKLCFVGLF